MNFGSQNVARASNALSALLLACLLVPGVSSAQSSNAATSGKKPASSKSSTTHHRTTASVSQTKSSGAVHTASSKHSAHRKKSVRVRGQQKIDSERAQAIQEALIREHYLSGEATGTWNQASEDAMRRYQEDNGWQSKTVPDSRALIKLRLGPSKDHLLNPDSAMTTVPDAPKAQPLPTTSNTAPAVADPVPPASTASSPAPNNPSSPQ